MRKAPDRCLLNSGHPTRRGGNFENSWKVAQVIQEVYYIIFSLISLQTPCNFQNSQSRFAVNPVHARDLISRLSVCQTRSRSLAGLPVQKSDQTSGRLVPNSCIKAGLPLDPLSKIILTLLKGASSRIGFLAIRALHCTSRRRESLAFLRGRHRRNF